MKTPIRIAAVLCMAGTVAACDAGAQLAVAGAVALFGVGAAAIHEGTKDQTSYCAMTSGQVYTRYGDCAVGDREVDSAEYQRLYKQHAADETRQKIAANEAARSAKTYCLTGVSDTPYISASGKCQSSDRTISEDEYKSRKTDQANLSASPTEPIVEQSSTGTPGETTTPKANPESNPAIASKPATKIDAPKAAATQPPAGRAEMAVAAPSATLPLLPRDAKPVSSGTAFFVADSGRLLTNHHVIEGCDWIGLWSDDGLHPAILLADSPTLDLAVLKTDFDAGDVAVFSDRAPDIGEDSYVAGYPLLDKLWSLNFTNGIVSSLSPAGEQTYLQTTAAVQPGNSGGPMFDSAGHVVGVIVARLADKSAQNVNFAIKAGVATRFMNSSGVVPTIAAPSGDKKASVIARSAQAIVVPALCFERS